MLLLCFHIWICGSACATDYMKWYFQLSALSCATVSSEEFVTTRGFTTAKLWSNRFQNHLLALVLVYFAMGFYGIMLGFVHTPKKLGINSVETYGNMQESGILSTGITERASIAQSASGAAAGCSLQMLSSAILAFYLITFYY